MTWRCSKRSVGVAFAHVLAVFLLAASAAAQDKKEDIPKKVATTLLAKFPKAQIDTWTKEKEGDAFAYDIEFKQDGHRFGAYIKEDGTLLSWEREVAVKNLPRPVAAAVDRKYPKSRIKEAMEGFEVKDGKDVLDSYEVVVETAEKREVELTIAPDGRILEDSGEKKEK
jgi:uncharacterized membrane protein YkoI